MAKIKKTPLSQEDNSGIINHIYKRGLPIFMATLAKRTINDAILRDKIIIRFIQEFLCRKPYQEIQDIWRNSRGILEIRRQFINFLNRQENIPSPIIQGKTDIIIHFIDNEPIAHSIAINPEIEIRRLRNMISNEYNSEEIGLIFELMIYGFDQEAIAIKTEIPTAIIIVTMAKIKDYIRRI